MTYRDRREARAERLREWADKRDAKAAAGFARAEQISSGIPMGQPILVGHHSEGRARRDQAKIVAGMAAGIESSRKAESFRSRADSIEAAAEHAIYSDDRDALERLKERIAGLEAERDRIKAYNASCRKGSPDRSVLDDKQRADLASVERYSPYQIRDNGAAPAYWLSNLSGNLNRQKKRLPELEARAAQRARVDEVLAAERAEEEGRS